MLVTAGGIYSHRMLQTSLAALGVDRVLLVTDDPFQQQYANGEAFSFIASAPISLEDQAKVASINAHRLLFTRQDA
jgi:hypothetical protein